MKKSPESSLSPAEHLARALSKSELLLIGRLTTPNRVQLFMDELGYAAETVYRSPLRVLRERACQCFDGAVLAAALLYRIGYPAVVLNLLPNNRDDDHVLALFRRDGHWGAVAKSNFSGLRFREPIHRTVRELVMSYFEQYYNVHREKTLRGYAGPLALKAFDRFEWMTRDETMELIAGRLDGLRRFPILTKRMTARLSLVDMRSCQAGLHGANQAGLSKPPRKSR